MTATLEFRGLDLLSQRDPANAGEGIRIQIVRGFLMPPDPRGEDYIVAARPGRIPGNRVPDLLTIGLAGYVVASTAAMWRQLTDDLIEALTEGDGIAPGDLIARTPYLGLATGSASITARVKNVIEGEIQAQLFQRWSIELESTDPAWTLGA